MGAIQIDEAIMRERELNTTQAADRIIDAGAEYINGAIERYVDKLAKLCESEIELILGGSLIVAFALIDLECPRRLGKILIVASQDEEEQAVKLAPLVLIPQYEWNNYRIDFVIRQEDGYTPKYIFIECDGHDFHEKTKEQAERDKSRDRNINCAGVLLLRFTGSEIYRDPTLCVKQIIQQLGEKVREVVSG